MSGFKKTLLIITSLLGIFILVLCASLILPIPYVSDWVNYTLHTFSWATYTGIFLLGGLGLFFVVLLLVSISAQRPIDYLFLKTETGTIKIAKDAVISALLQSLADIPECRQAAISLAVHRRKTEVSVTVGCYVSDLSLVNELGIAIQQRISECLSTTIGLPARNINVKIKEDKTKIHSKNSRVI